MTDRWAALGSWLAPRVGATGPVRVEDIASPRSTGYSAETVMFSAVFDTDAGSQRRRLVLRAETPDPAVYPAQAPGLDVEIEIQRRIMGAVAASAPAVPVASIVGAEPGGSVIGTPFFVMGFVEGEVPEVDPPYPVSGFFASATPSERSCMVADGLRVLAAFHAMDWRAAGLGWLAPGGAPTLARQLDLWDGYGHRELGDRYHPVFEAALEVLRRHLPAGSTPSLCWGDPRLGNMIWRDFRCVCVTDFEAAAIAPPELDLGWWLMFDRSCHEVVGAARLDGEPTREEQQERYEAAAGRAVGDMRLHQVFAATRYAAIVVRVMNRAVVRGQIPADHTIWLANPAATCLQQLLDS